MIRANHGVRESVLERFPGGSNEISLSHKSISNSATGPAANSKLEIRRDLGKGLIETAHLIQNGVIVS